MRATGVAWRLSRRGLPGVAGLAERHELAGRWLDAAAAWALAAGHAAPWSAWAWVRRAAALQASDAPPGVVRDDLARALAIAPLPEAALRMALSWVDDDRMDRALAWGALADQTCPEDRVPALVGTGTWLAPATLALALADRSPAWAARLAAAAVERGAPAPHRARLDFLCAVDSPARGNPG